MPPIVRFRPTQRQLAGIVTKPQRWCHEIADIDGECSVPVTYAQPPLHASRAKPGTPGTASVQSEFTSAALVVRVHGVLDGETGACLLAEVEQAATAHPPRIEIDLGALDGFTPEGAAALAACKEFYGRCQGGLHYRTLDGPGRQAFLAAFK